MRDRKEVMMDTALLLAVVLLLGVGAQWLGWLIKIPAILFLLAIGVIIGPILQIFNPDDVLGALLFPFISLGVAVILFEGSLTLKFNELAHQGRTIKRLVTLGAGVTIIILALGSYFLFPLDWRVALLFGALVCVTGPTVITPLLRSLRPNPQIVNILKWEGMLIDPIGAIAVVLVYEYMISGSEVHELRTFLLIVSVGLSLGMIGAWLLANLIKRHFVPDYLRNVFVLAFVLGFFAFSNHLAHESGLLTVTILGIALANWHGFPKESILAFKESLTILLVSFLFIILSARMSLNALWEVGWKGSVLLALAMFIARPIAVWICSIGSGLTSQEKWMISLVGPRGIVAAAISSLFALKLEHSGIQGVEWLVPLVFTIIIGTVCIQGLSAKPLVKFLGVEQIAHNGVLIVGANPVALMVAQSLQNAGVIVMVASRHYQHIAKARMLGLATYYGSPLSRRADNNLDLFGVGYVFAMSTDRETNTLCQWHYAHEFGANHIFRLRFKEDTISHYFFRKNPRFSSHWLFSPYATYSDLTQRLSQQARVKITRLTKNYSYERYQVDHPNFIPLYTLDKNSQLTVLNSSHPRITEPCRLVALVSE